MVLHIDGRNYLLGDTRLDTFASWISSLASVKEDVTTFKDKRSTIDSDSDLLYVHQGEMAIIHVDTNEDDKARCGNRLPKLVGSDDATSCIVVILFSKETCAIAHLDNHLRAESFFTAFKRHIYETKETQFTIHIVGGFSDAYGISQDTCNSILEELLCPANVVYRMGIFCVADNNICLSPNKLGSTSEMVEYPSVMGVIFDRVTNVIIPATINWTARGPLPALRLSRTLQQHIEALDIFDNHRCILIVKPFTYVDDPSQKRQPPTLDSLRNSSTTPEQEPVTYFEGSLAVYKLGFHHPDPMKSWFANGHLSFALRQDRTVICIGGRESHWVPTDTASKQAYECSLTHVESGTFTLH